jgi:hypothetical protein
VQRAKLVVVGRSPHGATREARSQVLLFDRPPTNADVDTLVAIIGMGEEPQIVVEGTVRPRTWEAVLGAPPPERWKGRGP